MPRRCALAPLAITHLNVLFPRPPAPSSSAARRPRPASHPLDGPRVVLLHLRRRAARHPPLCRRCRRRRAFSLPHPYSAASHGGHRPSLARCFPFVLSGTEREAAMTRVNLPQTPDRYRRTSASLSLYLSISLSLFLDAPPPLPSPYCRQLPPPLPITLLNQPPPPPLSPPR